MLLTQHVRHSRRQQVGLLRIVRKKFHLTLLTTHYTRPSRGVFTQTLQPIRSALLAAAGGRNRKLPDSKRRWGRRGEFRPVALDHTPLRAGSVRGDHSGSDSKLRDIDDADTDSRGRWDPDPDRDFYGNGFSAGNEHGIGACPPGDALAVGDQRSYVGMCFGLRRGDRIELGDFGFLLDRLWLLRACPDFLPLGRRKKIHACKLRGRYFLRVP